MVRRAYVIVFALVMALIGFATLPAAAQTGRTFYIDYASGSNSNSGSSKSTPWKTHPYMQTGANCTESGSAPPYAHVAGDQFIFKGGVTWPVACFQMSIPAGGNSGASDYYGVDQTWYSGGSFARPLFDMGQNVPGGRHVITAASSFGGYATFDNLEIANQQVPLGAVNADDAYNFAAVTGSLPGVLIENGYIHDWISNTDVAAQSSSFPWPYSAGSIDDGHDRITVDHMTVSGAGSWIYNGSTKVTGGYSGGCVNCGTVSNSTWHDVGAFCFTVPSCHDNEVYNVKQSSYDLCACRPHSQVVEDDEPSGTSAGGWMKVYNNIIHDNSGAGVTIYVPYDSYVYNNVMWNNANGNIRLTIIARDSASALGYVYNNTVDCSNNTPCIGTDSKGSDLGGLDLKNNQWITNGSPTCFGQTGCGSLNIVQSNNVTMSTGTAASEGYTRSNLYQPMASTGGTVNGGVSLSGDCSGALTSLCYDRLGNPRLTSWDAGAYEFGGQAQSSKPNPPTNLTATVQ